MPRTNLRLFIICPKKYNRFFDKVLEGIGKAERELRRQGAKVEYLYTDSHSVSRQTQLLTQVVDLRPDGIAIVPASSTDLNYLIDEAVNNDIPILTFNNDAPYSKRFCYVGPDNYMSGRLCGELMGNFLTTGGNVLVITGKQDNYGFKQRLWGFKDKIKASYPNIKIAKVISYSDNEGICYSNIVEELTGSRDIAGIFTTSATGSMMLGKVLKGLKLAALPKVIGFDPDEEISEYMSDDLIHALIYQDPFSQGYLSVKALYDYLSSGLVPEDENLFTKIEVVMQENLESFKNNDM